MEAAMSLKKLFTEHPDAVGELYFEHMGVALSFAGPLLAAGLAALVHAFPAVPVRDHRECDGKAALCAHDQPHAARRARPCRSHAGLGSGH